jgi:hypothetical protein
MVRFPRKTKTPIVKGVGKDREVAVETTYVGGPGLLHFSLEI